jgi:hypothetical protein
MDDHLLIIILFLVLRLMICMRGFSPSVGIPIMFWHSQVLMSKTIYIGFHFIPFLDVDQVVYFGHWSKPNIIERVLLNPVHGWSLKCVLKSMYQVLISWLTFVALQVPCHGAANSCFSIKDKYVHVCACLVLPIVWQVPLLSLWFMIWAWAFLRHATRKQGNTLSCRTLRNTQDWNFVFSW